MRFLRLIFAILVSCALILSGYYFIWNFMANKRMVTIVNALESSDKFKFDYKDSKITGYPNNINITFDKMTLKSKDAKNQINYKLGDTLFKIFPFVFEEQAEIIVPSSHAFSLKYADQEKLFKLQTSSIDISFLENKFNLEFSDLKIFDIEANKLLISADKVYYTGFTDSASKFKFNAKNLKFKNQEIDSILLDIELKNLDQLDMYSILLNLLVLDGSKVNKYFNENVQYLKDKKSIINIKTMKFVNDNVWYELSTSFNLDSRNRVNGSIDIVTNEVNLAQNILRTITANDKIDIQQIDLIKRLVSKNQNNLVRISGELKRGFLQIFNEKVARVKSIKR